MFKQLTEPVAAVSIDIDGQSLRVPASWTVAAALLARTDGVSRSTPVSGASRGPFCMMGVCFDCLVEIDGEPNRQACMIRVEEGMKVRKQLGARKVEP